MENDLKEIEALFKKHHGGLCNLAWRLLNDQQQAKDVVQEVFIAIWQRRAEIDLSSSMKSYLYKAVSNASLNELRKQAKVVRLDQKTAEELIALEQIDMGDSEKIEKAVRAAINRLPPKCKTIFVLSKYQGLKYREIAGQLDVSVKTVESQMGIALGKLRKELRPFLNILLNALVVIFSCL